MIKVQKSRLRTFFKHGLRKLFGRLHVDIRFVFYRLMVDADSAPDARLELKIASTQDELEDCFRILHDAYVSNGFMKPAVSGMRITPYHALPTTTTLCAKFDGRVVGTMSMIREGIFGFPLQSIFDLEAVRAKGGNIAEISALAIHPDFRKTGGSILFPLMKFMHQYCTEFFDTRHLIIAVNPEKIELYEALLFFERLQELPVDRYDFANGAPAIGAVLDLKNAREVFKTGYKNYRTKNNLFNYFFMLDIPNIKFPTRRYHTTNDPVMTPAILDYFFNNKTKIFPELDDKKKSLLWSIYNTFEYRRVLPFLTGSITEFNPLRLHQRYSIKCPALIKLKFHQDSEISLINIIEISLFGFQAESKIIFRAGAMGEAEIDLGNGEKSSVSIGVVRSKRVGDGAFSGFRVIKSDQSWRNCVSALEVGQTSNDLLQ